MKNAIANSLFVFLMTVSFSIVSQSQPEDTLKRKSIDEQIFDLDLQIIDSNLGLIRTDLRLAQIGYLRLTLNLMQLNTQEARVLCKSPNEYYNRAKKVIGWVEIKDNLPLDFRNKSRITLGELVMISEEIYVPDICEIEAEETAAELDRAPIEVPKNSIIVNRVNDLVLLQRLTLRGIARAGGTTVSLLTQIVERSNKIGAENKDSQKHLLFLTTVAESITPAPRSSLFKLVNETGNDELMIQMLDEVSSVYRHELDRVMPKAIMPPTHLKLPDL